MIDIKQRGKLELPDAALWQQELNAQREALKLEEQPLGLVLYTDGGCRPNGRGPGGWGCFGYFYHSAPPKQGHGGKGFVPTAQGLITSSEGGVQKVKEGEEPVTVIRYLEARGGLTAPATNNEAEAVALYHAMRLIEHVGVKKVFLRLDSEYALNGIQGGAQRWAKAGWRKADGSIVANHLWWRETIMLFDKLLDSGTSFRFEWVKGHSDSVGNWYADFLATSGIFGTQNDIPDGVVKLYSPKGYWNYSPDRPTFLSDPLWYMDPDNTPMLGDMRLFYTGNHFGKADDEDAGVAKSKSYYAIAALKSHPKHIDTVLEFLNTTANRGRNHCVIGRLDALFGRMAHRELNEFGCTYLSRPSETPNVVFGSEVALARVSDPPLLIYRAFDHLEPLEYWLKAYINNTLPEDCRQTDLTPFLFETTQEDPKKPPVTKICLKPGDKQYLDIPVTYHWKGEDRTVTLRLLIGSELPSRNFFSAIADKNAKVTLLTMPEALFETPGFRYRVVVEADGEYYIREASYSNLWFGA